MKFGRMLRREQQGAWLMYKSNNSKREELLNRLKGERSLLASTPNLSNEDLEELDRYDEIISDLEYELNNNNWF